MSIFRREKGQQTHKSAPGKNQVRVITGVHVFSLLLLGSWSLAILVKKKKKRKRKKHWHFLSALRASVAASSPRSNRRLKGQDRKKGRKGCFVLESENKRVSLWVHCKTRSHSLSEPNPLCDWGNFWYCEAYHFRKWSSVPIRRVIEIATNTLPRVLAVPRFDRLNFPFTGHCGQ